MRKIFIFICLLISAMVAAGEERVQIASIFSKTGAAANSNQHHIQAIRYAVDELNAKGGILGRRVELVEFDNGSTPIQSRLAAEAAVQHGVMAVLGASWSSHSLAMAPVFQAAGIPMVSPDSTTPGVTEVGDYIFRACFLDSLQGRVLARFAIEALQAKTAVILQDMTSDYSMGLAEYISKEFIKRGGTVAAVCDYRQDQKDFKVILEKVRKLDPDVLYIPGYDESGLIVKQAQHMGVRAIPMGGDGWADWNFWVLGGRELRVGYYTTHWAREVETPKSLAFAHDYQKIYDLDALSALAYDATMLLADAMERAGALDRKRIRDALANTRNFEGVTGTITMNEAGDPEKPVVLMKISDGKLSLHSLIAE